MKQTNYQLFDFLDFDTALSDDQELWVAGKPSGTEQLGAGVALRIPFQKQQPSVELAPDNEVAPKEFRLILRAYGERVLRVFIDFESHATPEDSSPMLEMNRELKPFQLRVESGENSWRVLDEKNRLRAVVNLTQPETAYWSDLLPPPGELLDIVFYPDGENAVPISAWDRFFPARCEALPLAFTARAGKPQCAVASLRATPGERFTGTGERFAKMDLSGQTFYLNNQDAQGVNNRRTYKNVPFYLSSQLYGAFIHTAAAAKLSLAGHSSRSVQILTEAACLDLFLIGGNNPEQILRGYRGLTGFPALPPRWSFGIWMSRMSYFSAAEVTEICQRLRQEEYPCDVIHLDTGWFRKDWLCEWQFNPERFPDPAGFIADLKKKGFRLSLWQMPYIARDAAQYEEASTHGYIGTSFEQEDASGSNFSALDYAGTIDLSYPPAVDWYKGLLKQLLDMGVVCIKTDFGEEIHMHARYHSMEPGMLKTLYPLLYQRAAYEITEECHGEGIIWARAGWAGCQRYPLHWGGDAAATWEGMAGSLKGGLHLGLSGFGFWSHDVPGFHGVPDFMNAVISEELYLRWTQFGVFTSHIRYHGTSAREPYHFPGISRWVRHWWMLRYALIPYILEQSRKTTESGYPVLRALIFHNADDKTCWHIDDQYYFGDDFLVAPLMEPGGKREVYLPAGEWVDFFTGALVQGARWLKVTATAENMPVWVRRNASLPLYLEKVSCTDDMDLSSVSRIKIDNSFKGIWKILPLNDNKYKEL